MYEILKRKFKLKKRERKKKEKKRNEKEVFLLAFFACVYVLIHVHARGEFRPRLSEKKIKKRDQCNISNGSIRDLLNCPVLFHFFFLC